MKIIGFHSTNKKQKTEALFDLFADYIVYVDVAINQLFNEFHVPLIDDLIEGQFDVLACAIIEKQFDELNVALFSGNFGRRNVVFV